MRFGAQVSWHKHCFDVKRVIPTNVNRERAAAEKSLKNISYVNRFFVPHWLFSSDSLQGACQEISFEGGGLIEAINFLKHEKLLTTEIGVPNIELTMKYDNVNGDHSSTDSNECSIYITVIITQNHKCPKIQKSRRGTSITNYSRS